MCRPRSCVCAAWKEIHSEHIKAAKYGGAVRSRVMVSLYPRVPTMEGKKLLNDCAVMSDICMTINMYSFGSRMACFTPQVRDLGSVSSIPAFSFWRRQSCCLLDMSRIYWGDLRRIFAARGSATSVWCFLGSLG